MNDSTRSLRLSVQVLCGTERTNWLSPYLVGGLLSLTSKVPLDLSFVVDQRPHEFARNQACENALKAGVDWVLLIDNDAVIPTNFADLVLQADRDADINIVCCCSWMLKQSRLMTNIWRDKNGLPELSLAAQTGFQEIAQGGAGVLLVRRRILETLPRPWFHMPLDPETGQPLDGEDVYLCRKARAAGFKVHTHSEFPIGHLKTMDLKAAAEQVAGKRPDFAIDLRGQSTEVSA